jgi:hypothetical protein
MLVQFLNKTCSQYNISNECSLYDQEFLHEEQR